MNAEYLMVVILIPLFCLTGCSESIEEDDGEDICWPLLLVKDMSLMRYPRIETELPSNSGIAVEFSNNVDYARINVSDCTGFTFIDGGSYSKRVIWMPLMDISLGKHTMTVDASRHGICKLEYFEPLGITVTKPDEMHPRIIDMECNPQNGSTDVAPGDYKGLWLIIRFSEWMLNAQIVDLSVGLDFIDQISGSEFLFKFVQRSGTSYNELDLPYNTEFVLILSGVDLAGNELATTKYTFVTKKKQP